MLDKLQTNQRPEIAQLAEAVLWRAATPPDVKRSASKWLARLDALPMVLQTGPTATLIDKLRGAGQADAANHLQWSLELTPIHQGLH